MARGGQIGTTAKSLGRNANCLGMGQWEDNLESIAETFHDYREGEIARISVSGIEYWAQQFPHDVREPVIAELVHVFQRSYISGASSTEYLSEKVATSEELTGGDPAGFWSSVNVLDIQRAGRSQSYLRAHLREVLKSKLSVDIGDYRPDRTAESVVYIDDGIWSGNRCFRDLSAWLEGREDCRHIHVITLGLHSGSYYYRGQLEDAAAPVQIHWWRGWEIENRKSERHRSDILWPAELPDDAAVATHVGGMKYPPTLRTGSHVGDRGFFSSDSARRLLEREFLIAGVHARNICTALPSFCRPLGATPLDTLGFGSMLITHRNCPNGAPLVLWAGDPWIPLLPRRTN